MPTKYEEIYANVLTKFRSYEIPNMTEEEVKMLLHDYFIPAIVRFHVCRKNLDDRNDELETFNVELNTTEIEILSNFLLLEYIDSNCIRVPTVLKASLSSSDFNAFSPAHFLDKLLKMHSDFLHENEGLLSRYAWMGAKESGALKVGYNKK